MPIALSMWRRGRGGILTAGVAVTGGGYRLGTLMPVTLATPQQVEQSIIDARAKEAAASHAVIAVPNTSQVSRVQRVGLLTPLIGG